MCNTYNIECDAQFNIIQYEKNLDTILSYDNNELIGKPITVLMSPFIASLHIQWFERLKNIKCPFQMEIVSKKLKRTMTNISTRIAIFNKYDDPIFCNLSVDINFNKVLVQLFIPNEIYKTPILLDTIPIEYQAYIGQNKIITHSYENIVCVMLDLANSTEYAFKNGENEIAVLLTIFYQKTFKLICKYHPYIYIHEICGDAIFIVANAPFMTTHIIKSIHYITLFVLAVIQKDIDDVLMTKTTNMFTRVGISFGNVSAGIIDSRSFRLFGSSVHLCQRMESLCAQKHIAFTESFYKNLINLDSELKTYIKTHECDIKGIGKTTYYSIESNDIIQYEKKHKCIIRESNPSLLLGRQIS